ncbi:MAG TPA: GAF domain-containing protein [Nannocystaceae bacterium]|nr:GAF domain-containing protein [Nannocystaceae bacterium]
MSTESVEPLGARDPETLVEELGRRREIESALRSALRELEADREVLQTSTTHLQLVTDAVPALVAYIDIEQRYRFVNAAYERWFGVTRASVVGKTMREVLGDAAHTALADHIRVALDGRNVTFSTNVPYRSGGARAVEGNYVPDLAPDGRVRGFVALVTDVTEREALDRARDAAASQAELLVRVTSAIAEAVAPEDVYAAIVDRVARALDASTAGLWVVPEGERVATMVRANGYGDVARAALGDLAFDEGPALPIVEALRERKPVYLASKAELVERYPECAPLTDPQREYAVACLPVLAHGQLLGAIGLTFDRVEQLDADRRRFLHLVAHYSGQALGRLRLLAHQRELRERAELLYRLAAAVIGAEHEEDVFGPALDALDHAVGTSRAAILACDDAGVMRFKAWRGISDAYRAVVDGHSPWPRDAIDPQPVLVTDVDADEAMAGYLGLFRREGIGALAFIPLVNRGRLIGKLMLYFATPRELATHELAVVRAIADHVSAALIRFGSFAELQRTVRFNELFTGMLGHDLRNPLNAMVMAAQAVMLRPEAEKLVRPLSRILNSGDRMARMIDQLLDFTRVRVGGGIGVEPSRIELFPVIRHVVDELDDANPDWQIRVERSGDTRGSWDGDRLAQVFSNLVGNAIQHGEIEHGVDVVVDGNGAELVEIEVRNKGVIPADELPLVFDAMVEGRRRDRARGLGLGLYISREIVRAHGGRIQVRSSAAEGTVFSVWLPRNVGADRAPR